MVVCLLLVFVVGVNKAVWVVVVPDVKFTRLSKSGGQENSDN